MRKYFLLPLFLSLAAIFVTAEFAQAQPNRGNRGNAYGNYYNRYYSPWSGYGYYGNVNRGYYQPYYYPRVYTAPAYTYPPTVVYPAPQTVVTTQYLATDTANVRVLLPDPTARVWFDGSLTQQSGTDRLFSTSGLTPGYSYSYHIRATWLQGAGEMTREQTVSVVPGQTVVADFR